MGIWEWGIYGLMGGALIAYWGGICGLMGGAVMAKQAHVFSQ